jgi:hypothetical protein
MRISVVDQKLLARSGSELDVTDSDSDPKQEMHLIKISKIKYAHFVIKNSKSTIVLMYRNEYMMLQLFINFEKI